jgi:choline-sulfatase
MISSFHRSPVRLIILALAVAGCALGVFVYRSRQPQKDTAAPRRTAAPLPGGIRTPVYAPVAGPRFKKANVLIVTVDTVRRDHLAPYGAPFDTPAASRLAREGAVFDHAVSQVPLTLPSHSSVFTGLYPPHHTVRDNGGFVLGKDATTLAERLEARGYATAGFVSSYVLHSRWGIAQGFQTYDDQFDYAGLESRSLTDVERPAGPVVSAALAWLRQPQRAAKPFCLWVHLYDAHWPYEPPDEYRRRAPTAYAGEVMYADAQVARLLDALDAAGLQKNTIVVYASDHGESLGEHGEPTHGIFLYGASLDVPLIIAPPRDATLGAPPLSLAGVRVRGLARLVDVTPTILDLLGLPVPDGLDGISLLPLAAAERGSPAHPADTRDAIAGPAAYSETYYPRFHYNWSELTALQTTRWRYVRAPTPELYDLERDPKQQHDISGERPEIAATLARQLEAMHLDDAGDGPVAAPLDPEARAGLQALGYVSGAETGSSRRTGPRPDPKEGLPLLNELLQAQTDRDAGRLDEALRRLEALARKDAENPAVFVALSSVYDRRKDSEGAIRAAKRAVALDPESSVAVLDLAFAFKGAGKLAEAATGFERVLALDPDNVKALLNLGEIIHDRGDRERAFELYQRAVNAAPKFARAQISLGSAALELNRLEVARRSLEAASALGGRQPQLHFNLGVMAEQRRDRAAAAREYRAEVAAFPDAVEAWVNLGLLERQAGRAREALAAFDKAASARPDRFEGPYLMADTLAALGKRADAVRWAEEAVRRNPGEERAQALLARLR